MSWLSQRRKFCAFVWPMKADGEGGYSATTVPVTGAGVVFVEGEAAEMMLHVQDRAYELRVKAIGDVSPKGGGGGNGGGVPVGEKAKKTLDHILEKL